MSSSLPPPARSASVSAAAQHASIASTTVQLPKHDDDEEKIINKHKSKVQQQEEMKGSFVHPSYYKPHSHPSSPSDCPLAPFSFQALNSLSQLPAEHLAQRQTPFYEPIYPTLHSHVHRADPKFIQSHQNLTQRSQHGYFLHGKPKCVYQADNPATHPALCYIKSPQQHYDLLCRNLANDSEVPLSSTNNKKVFYVRKPRKYDPDALRAESERQYQQHLQQQHSLQAPVAAKPALRIVSHDSFAAPIPTTAPLPLVARTSSIMGGVGLVAKKQEESDDDDSEESDADDDEVDDDDASQHHPDDDTIHAHDMIGVARPSTAQSRNRPRAKSPAAPAPRSQLCCICSTSDFIDPWISQCQHICCSECWVTWLNENKEQQCPECDATIELESLKPIALCSICSGVPIHAYSAPCTHVACTDCWLTWLAENPSCPDCQQPVDVALVQANKQ